MNHLSEFSKSQTEGEETEKLVSGGEVSEVKSGRKVWEFSQNTKKSIHKHSDGRLIILSQLDWPDAVKHRTEIISGLLGHPPATFDIWCVFVIWFLGLYVSVSSVSAAFVKHREKVLLRYWENIPKKKAKKQKKKAMKCCLAPTGPPNFPLSDFHSF